MKKYIIAVLLLFIPCVTYALTMCARDDSLVVTLNSGPNAGTGTYNASDFTWREDYIYTILGEATCLSELEGGLSTTQGSMTNIDGNKVDQSVQKGLQGIYNDDSVYGARKYCWCRMTHPALSRWVIVQDMGTIVNCRNTCAERCYAHMKVTPEFRKGMFNSIGK